MNENFLNDESFFFQNEKFLNDIFEAFRSSKKIVFR